MSALPVLRQEAYSDDDDASQRGSGSRVLCQELKAELYGAGSTGSAEEKKCDADVSVLEVAYRKGLLESRTIAIDQSARWWQDGRVCWTTFNRLSTRS